jgi:hypothetical protein
LILGSLDGVGGSGGSILEDKECGIGSEDSSIGSSLGSESGFICVVSSNEDLGLGPLVLSSDIEGVEESSDVSSSLGTNGG